MTFPASLAMMFLIFLCLSIFFTVIAQGAKTESVMGISAVSALCIVILLFHYNLI